MTHIEAMKQAHDLSLDGKHFEARQLLLEAIATEESSATQEPVFSFQMQLKQGWGSQYPKAQVIGQPDIESLFGKIGDIVTFYAARPKAEQEPKRKAVGVVLGIYGEPSLDVRLYAELPAGTELWPDAQAQPKAEQPAPAISEGYKLVPAEATIEMLAAAANECGISGQRVYRVMLAAAPAQPKAEQEPKRELVGLTDEERDHIVQNSLNVAVSIEDKLKEKNQ